MQDLPDFASRETHGVAVSFGGGEGKQFRLVWSTEWAPQTSLRGSGGAPVLVEPGRWTVSARLDAHPRKPFYRPLLLMGVVLGRCTTGGVELVGVCAECANQEGSDVCSLPLESCGEESCVKISDSGKQVGQDWERHAQQLEVANVATMGPKCDKCNPPKPQATPKPQPKPAPKGQPKTAKPKRKATPKRKPKATPKPEPKATRKHQPKTPKPKPKPEAKPKPQADITPAAKDSTKRKRDEADGVGPQPDKK